MLQSKEECQKSIKYGWVCALISMLFTLLLAVAGYLVTSDNVVFNAFKNPFLLLDVVLIGVLAFYMRKKSRTAVTMMLVYFVFSKWLVWSETGSTSGIGVAIIFLYFYFMAMLATYRWHSSYSEEEELRLNSADYQL